MPVGDIESQERGSGARYNDGKPEYSQIPLHLLEDTARVLMYGEKKYAKFNWLKGMDWSIPYDSMQRHMIAWYKGEENDSESGLPHLAHAICNLLMLTAYRDIYPEGDDRPKEYFE